MPQERRLRPAPRRAPSPTKARGSPTGARYRSREAPFRALGWKTECVAVSWERSFELSAVRAHLVRASRYALPLSDSATAASMRVQPPCQQAARRHTRVCSAQQNPQTGPADVPFAAMFDTELSRKWNVSPRSPRRRKPLERADRG